MPTNSNFVRNMAENDKLNVGNFLTDRVRFSIDFICYFYFSSNNEIIYENYYYEKIFLI